MDAPAASATAATLKAELHHIIDEIADPNVLQAALVLLQPQLAAQSGDFWDEMTEVQQQELRKGIEEADAGQTIPMEEVMARLKQL
jgi:predicted transcriptional regulator